MFDIDSRYILNSATCHDHGRIDRHIYQEYQHRKEMEMSIQQIKMMTSWAYYTP